MTAPTIPELHAALAERDAVIERLTAEIAVLRPPFPRRGRTARSSYPARSRSGR
jgi:hypothetical protein